MGRPQKEAVSTISKTGLAHMSDLKHAEASGTQKEAVSTISKTGLANMSDLKHAEASGTQMETLSNIRKRVWQTREAQHTQRMKQACDADRGGFYHH